MVPAVYINMPTSYTSNCQNISSLLGIASFIDVKLAAGTQYQQSNLFVKLDMQYQKVLPPWQSCPFQTSAISGQACSSMRSCHSFVTMEIERTTPKYWREENESRSESPKYRFYDCLFDTFLRHTSYHVPDNGTNFRENFATFWNANT